MKRNTGFKVALYDPYLDTLGGGEKHILSIIQVLDELDYEINIFWDENISQKIENKFAIHYINKLKFLPNIFKTNKNIVEKIYFLKKYDHFFYVTDGSYFFSSAKKNFVFCMVPDKKLYKMSILNQLKLWNYSFISNSLFTGHWLGKWGIKSKVLLPYVDDKYLNLDMERLSKEKIILSVGRFFPHLHSKQHSLLIDWFLNLQKNNREFESYKLIIAGGLKTEDVPYFEKLKKRVKNHKSISLIPNLPFPDLLDLYKRSALYVHATGYEVNEDVHPELVEHLGITPLEAMSAGAITFCYKAGGPKELIKDGENGYLFSSFEELTAKIKKVTIDIHKQKQVITVAHSFVKKYFSYSVFKDQVKKIIL